jgi:hypothetical protein
MDIEKRIETLYKEFTSINGRKSPEFRRGWVQAIKTWQKKEVDSFIDELYNDIEQEKFMKENGGINAD